MTSHVGKLYLCGKFVRYDQGYGFADWLQRFILDIKAPRAFRDEADGIEDMDFEVSSVLVADRSSLLAECPKVRAKGLN